MSRKIISALALLAIALPFALGTRSTEAATGDPVLINEVFASHTGTDDTEFLELFGTPGTNLSGLSLIVVEGDAFGPGAIDRRFDFRPFHQIGSNGFFLIGNCGGVPTNYGVTPDASLFTNYFENSSLTVALVETASLSGSSVTGGEVVRDAVALTDGDAGDTFFFGAPVIGPDGTFFPAGARRVADGVDTDTAADWVISNFFLGSANTPTSGGLDGCAPIPLTIPEIQGAEQRSLYEGEVVTTSGVVTLITANGSDMWIQDPTGDGDPATSDGIFVDDRDDLSPLPQVGDFISITATVEEQQFGNALPLTRLNNPEPASYEILSSGNTLPAPVGLADLPDFSITEGIDFWEPLEGMLVSIRNAPVVAPTSRFGEFAMLTNEDAKPGSGFFPQNQQILVRDLGGENIDYNPERILVDDSSLDEAIVVMPGDRVRSLVGVVDYTFGNYKLQPASYDVMVSPRARDITRSGPNGNVTITTYNVENLFDLADNPDKDDIGTGGAESEEELEVQVTKLALSIQEMLELPDILVLQEVENTEVLTGDGDGYVPGSGVMALLPRLPGSWDAVSFETSDGRGIEVAMAWNTDEVTLLDAFQLAGPDVETWFGPSSPSPGREPLVGIFDVNGEMITIVGNHFKSKGGDDPLFGVNWPPIRVTEVQRKGQAGVVRDFVNTILDDDPNALVMVTGDLNDFAFSEPGEGPDNPVAILEGASGEVPLFNLLNLEKEPETYTFIFDGNSQVLDHMLVSPALLEMVQGADILHFNAGFPSDLGEDPRTPFRAADHDPLEGRFWIK
jgi:predicted extracellular nuclease